MAKIKLSPTLRMRIAPAMLVLAAVMFVDTLYQVGMHTTWRFWIARQARAMHPTTQPSTQPSTQPATQPANDAKKAGPPEIAAAIRARNIYTAPPPTGHGLVLTGVIGDTALFGGRGGSVGIKEGKSARGVTVKSINDAYEVVIEYKGKPETLKLFGGPGAPGAMPGGPEMPQPPPGAAMARGPREMRAQTMPAGAVVPGAPVMIEEIPPELRERMQRERRGRRGD